MTRPAKPSNPAVKAGGVKIFSGSDMPEENRRHGPRAGAKATAAAKRAAPKPVDIGDQISQHLRGIYDDVLNQPVPGRFLELLQQLESTPATRPGKDGK